MNQEAYTIYSANVPLKKARVICIGLNHEDADSVQNENRIIKEHTGLGHLLAIEGREKGRRYPWRLSRREFGVKFGTKTIGWDDIKKYDESDALQEESNAATTASEELGISMQERLHLTNIALEKQKESNLKALQRNDSLNATIKDTLRKFRYRYLRRKLILQAGSAHFYENPELLNLIKDQPYAIIMIKEGKNGVN